MSCLDGAGMPSGSNGAVWAGTGISIDPARLGDEFDGSAANSDTFDDGLNLVLTSGIEGTASIKLSSNTLGTKVYYGVWFDWNRNGNFADDGVSAFHSGSGTAGDIISFPVTQPINTSNYYPTRLIVSDKEILFTGFDDIYTNGEVEDYRPMQIGGTVYDDANGGNPYDSVVLGTNAGGLIAILVNQAGNVVANAAVAPTGTFRADGTDISGTYNFSFIKPNTEIYSILLSTAAGIVGSPPPSPGLPPGWMNTWENDATIDGILTNVYVSDPYVNVGNNDFGINKRPVANNIKECQPNVQAGTQITIPTLTGSDLEDGTYDGNSGTNTIKVVTLPTNGELKYNGSTVTIGQEIPTYTPTLLIADPVDGSDISFTFSEIDAAGAESLPATVTIAMTANAGVISGTSNICITSTTLFTSDGEPGGVWTSDNTSIATVDRFTGIVIGVGAGSATITYALVGCAQNTKVVTVNPDNTIILDSVGTDGQTKCINAPITDITYTTTGATGAIFSGLPAGITGNFTGNLVTISGTPLTTTGSPFNYTITLTGGCGIITATGTITVNPNNTITLSSSAGTDSQTKCVNTAITNITYATAGATGVTFSGLPAGVTGDFFANVVTISGTPSTTTGSPFGYTVTLEGGCGSMQNTTGTITVLTPPNAGTVIGADNICIASTTPFTSDGDSGGVWSSSDTSIATVDNITGVVTGVAAGTATITYNIGCANNTKDITVNPNNNSITLSSTVGTDSQTICINTPITGITYTTTGATGIAFSGLPTGVTGNFTGNVVKISGMPSTTGGSPFNYTITLTGGCGVVTATGTITVNPVSVGGVVSSPQTICSGNSPADLTLSDNTGSIVKWQKSS
ncbi:beta strand repeat-containing protein, partial [Flavobacterium sp. T12S277]|uniref:beta strand repeat-containing protein n=1 Tax=Flavobacterium sp. T12S277 TaxID=3402752 RepID=UPI003AE8D096